MVRERDRATIENKLKALRATLVTAGHEGGVEAVLDAIVDRERARLTAEYVAANNVTSNTNKHEIDGVPLLPTAFPEGITKGERNRLERAKFLLKELVLRARPKALEKYPMNSDDADDEDAGVDGRGSGGYYHVLSDAAEKERRKKLAHSGKGPKQVSGIDATLCDNGKSK